MNADAADCGAGRRFAEDQSASAPAATGTLRKEASDRMRALEAAAGDAPRASVTGSIGDFLPRSLRGALRRHDLIHRLERDQVRQQKPPADPAEAAEAVEEARLRAYRHVDSRTIFDDDRPADGAHASAAPAPATSAYDLEQARLIRGLEAAAGPAAARAVLSSPAAGAGAGASKGGVLQL